MSILAGDQVDAGQYFSYPGRKFRYIADELPRAVPRRSAACRSCRNSIAWLRCEMFERKPMVDHELFFARVVDVGPGRLRSRRCCTRAGSAGGSPATRPASPGTSVRDELLARLAAAGFDDVTDDDDASDRRPMSGSDAIGTGR